MGKKYTVEQYTITRRDGGRWDVQSAHDVSEFATLEEAQAAFGAIDVKAEWLTEKNCSPSLAFVRCMVEAAELRECGLDEDGGVVESETVDYKEYGAEDYEEEGR